MKKNYFRSFMFVALGAMIVSCSKEKSSVVDTTTKLASTKESVPYELSLKNYYDARERGKDAPAKLYLPGLPENQSNKKYPFSIIQTPTREYLDETCLVDISKLEDNKTYHSIQNGKLTIGFFGQISDGKTRVLKLKSSSETGWNSKWGVSPDTENEAPEVLYTYFDTRHMYIHLSKPVLEFGFEIAPNHKHYDHRFIIGFGKHIFDYSRGTVNASAKSPSGARLVAIKADKPFTTITISSSDSPCCEPSTDGIAFANIRYKLAK